MMASSDSPIPVNINGLSVVIADDVVEIIDLLGLWLKEEGCRVTCATTGNEVTRHIRREAFDLIITDVLMPDGDGLDVINEVKRSHPETRVLAISGGGRHLQASDCLRLARGMGADEVLLKPFNRDQLMAAVSRIIQVGN